MTDLRVGSGFDTHGFAEGRPLKLGGVTIPHTHGLAGDSDADALLHALADALLGAAALGDLGRYYPPGEVKNHGMDSAVILTGVLALLTDKDWLIVNVDTTIIAQRPRLALHLDAMRGRIAELLKLDHDRVNVKAKSTDRLGFVGRSEGIAAMATVLIARAASPGRA